VQWVFFPEELVEPQVPLVEPQAVVVAAVEAGVRLEELQVVALAVVEKQSHLTLKQ
jgi:hypothetical protein